MTRDLNEIESDIVDSIRAHVAHGHGLITITIKPGSVRVQEGRGKLYDLPGTNGNKREKRP